MYTVELKRMVKHIGGAQSLTSVTEGDKDVDRRLSGNAVEN